MPLSNPDTSGFTILYEDPAILGINKTSYIPVTPSLLEKVKSTLPEENSFLGLVHRIDRPITGVVLFARNPKALAELNLQFKERKVKKIYWAVTEAPPPHESGTLEHLLLFDHKKNKSYVLSYTSIPPKGARKAKPALLDYRLVGISERYFFLEIELVTGRPHQIRCQLSAIGCHVKGDLKYGARRSNS
ncbi:MAG: RNA pseudouridine synthase, partial [Spirochaetales bacterium]